MDNSTSTLPTKSEIIINNYLQSVLKDIVSILRAECKSIFIFDNEKKELILDAFYNSHELNIERRRQKIEEGIAGKVADTKPLLSPRGLLGIMNISDKSNREPFSDKDFAFVVMLYRYACIIADNLASSERLTQKKSLQRFIKKCCVSVCLNLTVKVNN